MMGRKQKELREEENSVRKPTCAANVRNICYIRIKNVTLKSRAKGASLEEEASTVVGESDGE